MSGLGDDDYMDQTAPVTMSQSDQSLEFLAAWSTEELKGHPGFGYYPDPVWNYLETAVQYFLTQKKADDMGIDLGIFAADRKDEFRCTLLTEMWETLFPQLVLQREYQQRKICPPLWDGASCIPPTVEGEVAVFSCMTMYQDEYYDPQYNATRECELGGHWAVLTDYDYCQKIDGPVDTPDLEISIIVYFAGYSISLLALFVAVCMFFSFREMRCMRHKIHIGLFLTYIFADLAWIITALLQSLLLYTDGHQVCFIMWCSFRTLLSYFHLTTFFWMFLEGLYLFLQVQLPLSLANIKHKHFLVFGWGSPLLVMVIWSVLRTCLPMDNQMDGLYNSTDREELPFNDCPYLSEHPVDFLAYKMPVFILLVFNTFFLVWIMVIVVSKLRAQTVMEYDRKHWKAAKALIVVIPLLGFTYILTLIGPDRNKNPTAYLVFQFIRAVLLSTQGFVITLPYCFLNSELRGVVRTRWERWQLIRNVGAETNSLRTSVNCSTYFTADNKPGGQNGGQPGGNGHQCQQEATFGGGRRLLDVPQHHHAAGILKGGNSRRSSRRDSDNNCASFTEIQVPVTDGSRQPLNSVFSL